VRSWLRSEEELVATTGGGGCSAGGAGGGAGGGVSEFGEWSGIWYDQVRVLTEEDRERNRDIAA